MENFGKRSRAPDTLWISNAGGSGLRGEPHSLVEGDLLRMNILLCAYEKPVTCAEIAGALGVAAAYVEQIVGALVSGELMRQTPSGRVYTDFIIFTPEDRAATSNAQRALVEKNIEKYEEPLRAALSELRGEAWYAAQPAGLQAQLELYFALGCVGSTGDAARRAHGETPYSAYPHRRDGGRWVAFGNFFPAGYESPPLEESFAVSGEARWERENVGGAKALCLSEYETRFAPSPRRVCGIPDDVLTELLWALHSGAGAKELPFDAHWLSMLGDLEKSGAVRRVGGRFAVSIPVLRKSDFARLNALTAKWREEFGALGSAAFAGLYAGGGAPYPPHLDSVPPWLPYMFAASELTMRLITGAQARGFAFAGLPSPCPALILSFEDN